MKNLSLLVVLSMLSFSAVAAELEIIGDSSTQREYADRNGKQDFRLGLLAQFEDSWKIKLSSAAIIAGDSRDLTLPANLALQAEGQELADPQFMTLSGLAGAATAASFCSVNAISAKPGVIGCAASGADNVMVTIDLKADVEIQGSLKMTVHVGKEHDAVLTPDSFTSISLGGDVLASSSVPHSDMTDLNSTGVGYATAGYLGVEPSIDLPVVVEFPFKGASFKPVRTDDVVMYAQVESL